MRGVKSFLFYSYGNHRDLHSFPTRRSSDLASASALRATGRPATRGSRSAARSSSSSDRKSTRLNSSHTVMSYAVFCLKKKMKVNSIDHVQPTSRLTDLVRRISDALKDDRWL